jgi:hypothetical protein
MTVVHALATHDIVELVHPRPVREEDELGKAVGKALDGALSQFGYEFSQRRRPTAARMRALAISRLEEELADTAQILPAATRELVVNQIAGVLQAFRGSVLFGLPRPKSRMILINEVVGVYAQPDYWDARNRIFEMKSYHAIPPPPSVSLQLDMFQLAFPCFHEVLVCIDRHSVPVETTSLDVPALAPQQSAEILALALRHGLEHGQPKVLEYVDSPVVRYSI